MRRCGPGRARRALFWREFGVFFRGQPRRTTTHQQSTILLAIAVATAAATLPPPPQPPRRLRHVHGHRRLRLTPPLREKASCLFGLTSPFNREPT